MMDPVSSMAALCASRNATVQKCFENASVTLDAFYDREAEKVRRNRAVKPLKDPEDFIRRAGSFAAERLGDKAGEDVMRAAGSGAICTADHHGSLFSSQTFQGDLLFAEVLRKLDAETRYVPIFSAGQVELENSTYARGISAYTSPLKKQLFPFFAAKNSVQLASHAKGITPEMIARFRKQTLVKADNEPLKAALSDICQIYESAKVQAYSRFPDQATAAGVLLGKKLFEDGGGPLFAYLEIEDVVRPLLVEELSDPASYLSRMLDDPAARKKLSEITGPDGTSLAGLLFKGADEKGRKIALSLTEDGQLSGKDWRGQTVSYGTDRRELLPLLEAEKVFPGVFTIAFLLAFERGLTWFGGMFQSVYLPAWQEALALFFETSGLPEEADLFRSYACDAYICGPMFALYGGDGFATAAGPVEFFISKPAYEQVREMIRPLGLWDAHLIGLTEMYFDLVLRDEREPDWFRVTAEELYRRYVEETNSCRLLINR